MSFSDWFFGPARFTVTYPLVTVNGNLTTVELDALTAMTAREAGPVLACCVVVRDQTPPRLVMHLGADLAVTERLGRVLAHELNHGLSQLHGVYDQTHVIDGGVIAGD